MAEDRKRCENCWVMVKADLDICPNCSHPFPIEEPKKENGPEVRRPETSVLSPLAAKGRPFKFILLFLLSFITVLVFKSAEGMRLNGSINSSYLLGDVIWVSLVAFLMAVVAMFIDYIVSD